jgi:magnesium transporter
MADNDLLPDAQPHESQSPVDKEDRLRTDFVDSVLDAVEAGDDETARNLVQPLHPADVADLIELARAYVRVGLFMGIGGIICPEVLAELKVYFG